jgi:hypothetical protein
MIKKISLAMLCILMYTLTEAQISVRPYVGVNAANLTREFSDVGWQSSLGYQGGIDLMLGNRVYIQPGLQWELIRQNFDPANPIPNFNTRFQASHIRVPLMIGFRAFGIENGGLLNFRMYTGPDVAFTVSNSDHSFLGVDINKDTLNRLHWSWNGGIGFDILFLFVDMGYKFGLSDYFEGSIDNGSRSNVFFANAGLRIGF